MTMPQNRAVVYLGGSIWGGVVWFLGIYQIFTCF